MSPVDVDGRKSTCFSIFVKETASIENFPFFLETLIPDSHTWLSFYKDVWSP